MISKRRYKYLLKYLLNDMRNKNLIRGMNDRDMDMASDIIPKVDTSAIGCRGSLRLTELFCAKHQVDLNGVVLRCSSPSCDCGVLKFLLRSEHLHNNKLPDLFSRKAEIIKSIKSGTRYL